MTIRASFFAMMYDWQMTKSEEAGLRAMRQRLLADAAGQVIEIGAGTGANLLWSLPSMPEWSLIASRMFCAE